MREILNIIERCRYHHEMAKAFANPSERKDAIVREVVSIAKEINTSPAQVALAWVLAQGNEMIPVDTGLSKSARN